MSSSDPGDDAHDDTRDDDAPPQRTVTPEGREVPGDRTPGEADGAATAENDESSRIEEPAKVMRIGGMVKRLLDEVRGAPLDDAARTRLAEIHARSISELEDGLSPDLVEELHRITLPFSDDATPSDAELRVAQAQLVGWLEGLFHGIQTALVAQQMAAQAQLSQMRRLPPGAHPSQFGPHGGRGRHGDDGTPPTGQYL
jgi:hypothetical protein